jgi:hypothetical protein
MAATPQLALPYPVASDTADVPRDVKALADKLEAIGDLGVPVVTALPVAPSPGDEILFRVAPSVYWRFRYIDAVEWWAFLGGDALYSDIDTQESTTSTTYVDLATVGPQVPAVPLNGFYFVTVAASIETPAVASTVGFMAPATNSGSGFDSQAAYVKTPMAGPASASAYRQTRPQLNAGDVVGTKYRIAGGGAGIAAKFTHRSLNVLPSRVFP